MWFTDPREHKRDRRRERESADRGPDLRPQAPPEPPEAVRDDDPTRSLEPIELRPAADPHGGRRADWRGAFRQTRSEREEGVLAALGLFRVVSRKALVADCFDGHPFAAARTLTGLERRGTIVKRRVARGERGYHVYSLSAHGRDLIAHQRAAADADDPSRAGEQRYWAAGGDERQLRHDQHVYDAVRADVSDVLSRGGRIVRVRLESELRGRLASAEAVARHAGGSARAVEARRKEAGRLGLRVSAKGVPLPDVVVEIEDSDGRRLVRAIEVASGHYSPAQLAAKRLAGFRLYGLPHFRSEGRRQRRGTLHFDDPFPLSFGGGR